jgi:hypothetical protein
LGPGENASSRKPLALCVAVVLLIIAHSLFQLFTNAPFMLSGILLYIFVPSWFSLHTYTAVPVLSAPSPINPGIILCLIPLFPVPAACFFYLLFLRCLVVQCNATGARNLLSWRHHKTGFFRISANA